MITATAVTIFGTPTMPTRSHRYNEDVTFGLVAHGQPELRKMAASFFAGVPDFKLEIVSSTSMGNRGSVEWVFSGTDVGLYMGEASRIGL